MSDDLEKDKVYTCEICNDYQGTKTQLRGHMPHCERASKENSGFEMVVEPEIKEEPEPEMPPERKKRIPFGMPHKKLPDVPENDGYQYRVINDNWHKEPGRVMRAMAAGYEKVQGHESGAVGTNDDGSPIMGVLMRIPKELYEEDQKEKQKEIDKVDQAIRAGRFKEQPGDKRYIPDGIKIWSSHDENK